MKSIYGISVCAITLGLALGFADSAHAQTSETGVEAIEDIVVTARKREERLIEVPIAITAMTGDTLDQRGARSLADVLQEAPGVGIFDTGDGITKITVRGISTTLGANENGYYLDELPFTGVNVPLSPDVRSWDLDRIEVLRGPQGTLFGEGSMGGTIRILTRDPDLDDWSAKGLLFGSDARGGGGNYGAKGALNIPIVADKVALRVAGTHENFGGWIDDPSTGMRNVNDQRIDTFRAKLRVDPVERLSLGASYWLYDGRFDAGANAADDGTQPLSARLTNTLRYELIGATARYDLGDAELFYAFSHNSFDLPQTGDLLGAPLELGSSIRVTAHEARIASTGNGAFKWTAGYYHRGSRRADTLVYAPFALDTVMTARSTANAVFGEATYTLADAIDLTAGLRYFHDRIDGREASGGVVAPVPGKSYESLNPRFSLAWRPDRSLTVYATVAKGFRSGQTQPLTASAIGDALGIDLPVNLSQDSLWSYELGAKADLLDGLMMVEGAIYHARWKDFAVRYPLGATGFNGLINSAGTRTTGVEANALLRPAKGLTVAIGGAWVDATYVEAVPGTGIVEGTRVDNVPKLSLNGSIDYRRPLSDMLTGNARIGFQHSSRRIAPSFAAYRPGDAITRVDARLGVEAGKWNVALFAENLTDERGAVGPRTVAPLGPGMEDVYAPRLRPRTIGIELGFRFGGN